jgi:hypothetical protein
MPDVLKEAFGGHQDYLDNNAEPVYLSDEPKVRITKTKNREIRTKLK